MRTTVLLAISLVLSGFAAFDAARRGRSWYFWSRLVFLTSVFGFIAWFVARRRAPIVTARLDPWRRVLLPMAGVPLFVFAMLLATFTTTFLVEPARIQGQAMAPTLQDQQRVIVNKLIYRAHDPHRGDVVMFRYPNKPEKLFVKRIIAEEGDMLRILDGRVYVNDVVVNDDAYVPANARSHDKWGPQVVPEGYVFVMGDNRINSSDSRHWGPVPKAYVLGRVSF
jgi:signal peptidase I